MSMKILDIQPEELQFEFKENQLLSSKLTIESKSKLPIYFKIKTTDQDKYLVKPHRGLLEPNRSVSIEIGIRPIGIREAEQVADSKFLISAMNMKERLADEDYDKKWKETERSDPSLVESQKIKVVLYSNEGNIKKFISNSRVDQSIKQSQMYKTIRTKGITDNQSGSSDPSIQQRERFEEMGRQLTDVEAKIRQQEQERKKVHSELLKVKQSTQKKSTDSKKNETQKLILMAFLGFLVSYMLFK